VLQQRARRHHALCPTGRDSLWPARGQWGVLWLGVLCRVSSPQRDTLLHPPPSSSNPSPPHHPAVSTPHKPPCRLSSPGQKRGEHRAPPAHPAAQRSPHARCRRARALVAIRLSSPDGARPALEIEPTARALEGLTLLPLSFKRAQRGGPQKQNVQLCTAPAAAPNARASALRNPQCPCLGNRILRGRNVGEEA
jgi:hypothetical protein